MADTKANTAAGNATGIHHAARSTSGSSNRANTAKPIAMGAPSPPTKGTVDRAPVVMPKTKA